MKRVVEDLCDGTTSVDCLDSSVTGSCEVCDRIAGSDSTVVDQEWNNVFTQPSVDFSLL